MAVGQVSSGSPTPRFRVHCLPLTPAPRAGLLCVCRPLACGRCSARPGMGESVGSAVDCVLCKAREAVGGGLAKERDLVPLSPPEA